nr:hypothetical protein [Tanacetum cinerariifolium]
MLDYDNQMANKYFAKYTGIKVKQCMETLLQHMSKLRSLLLKEHAIKNNMMEGETKSKVLDTSSRTGNDTDNDDAEIRPIYDEEPMAEVQLTTECNIFATGQQHTEQPKIINEELESLFGPLFDEYFNGENQVVSKSSIFTIADASDKRQQQPDSTSSTSTLATTISADGNFDM